MKRVFSAALLVLGWGVAQAAEEVKDIPLDKCNAMEALMTINIAALHREVEESKISGVWWHKQVALVDKHPEAKPGRPVSEVLSKEEATEFNRLSSQILVSNYYLLAESRLQRDTTVMMDMLDAAVALRDKHTEPQKGTPEYKYYTYIASLMEVFRALEHPDVKNTAECSLDLALQRDGAAAMKAMGVTIMKDPKFRELLNLRTKYGLPEGAEFDKTKMLKADANRLPALQKYVGELLSDIQLYEKNISNMRYFAETVQFEFEAQKSDILFLGPSRDNSEFNKRQAERYSKLSKPMQLSLNLWFYIDTEIPSQRTKGSQLIVDEMKKYPVKP